MQLVLATNNQDKIKEIKNLLDDLPVTILTKDDFLEFPDIEETGFICNTKIVLNDTCKAVFRIYPVHFRGIRSIVVEWTILDGGR